MSGLNLSKRFGRYVPLDKKGDAEPQQAPRPRRPKEKPVEGVTWFGIEQKSGPSVDLVQKVLLAAKAERLLFRKLDVLGTFSVGRFTYLKLRADHPNLDPVFRRLRNEGVSLVEPTLAGYFVTLPDGRTGKVPAATIHTMTQGAQGRSYLGTKMKRWEQQFAS